LKAVCVAFCSLVKVKRVYIPESVTYKHNVASVSKTNVKACRRATLSILDTRWRYAVYFALQPLDPQGCRYWCMLDRNATDQLLTFTMEPVRRRALVKSYSVRTRKFRPFSCCLPIV
jgi:hypothetical protein